jgi:Rieske Fe-S protein
MERREFIKTSCSLCIAIGSASVIGALSSCASIPTYETSVQKNMVAVPRSLFNNNNLQIIRVENFTYGIALEKTSNGNFTALLLRCTHASNPLTYTGNGFRCPLHGSKFDLEGDVIRGPAALPLQRLSTEISGDNILIHLH